MGSFANADSATGKLSWLAWWWKGLIKSKACAFKYVQAFLVSINNKNIMPGIGYITTGSFESKAESFMLPTDESVCGLLFDTSDFYRPFDDYPLLQQYFGNGETHLINNLTEAAMYGLCDENFMQGVPYYHLKQFYAYIGSDAPLYVCFTSDHTEWSAIESMQMAANGKIFQIGVWTSQLIWSIKDGFIVFTDLLGNLESAAEVLCGKVGESSLGSTPLSIIVSPNTSLSSSAYLLQDVPDATQLNFPKVSVCLVQNGTEEVHTMQQNCPNHTPVGCIGLIMACLHLAYAEENIGYVAKFNLNKNDDFENAEVSFGSNYFSVDSIVYTVGNIAAQRGYIIPCTYNGKEAEVFFSGDPTASNGDYNHIANNRIIHKCKRAVHSALMPYINGNYSLDQNSGGLSEDIKSAMTTDILTMLDSVMKNPLGQSQINSRSMAISDSGKILETDAITIESSIGLVNYNSVINEQDDYEV